SGRNIVQSKAPGLEVDVESIESDSSRQVFQRAAAGCTGKQPINGIFYQQKALARIDGAQATGKAGLRVGGMAQDMQHRSALFRETAPDRNARSGRQVRHCSSRGRPGCTD